LADQPGEPLGCAESLPGSDWRSESQPDSEEPEVEAKELKHADPSRTHRDDFVATSDPALQDPEDRAHQVKLLDYGELYNLWERQQWLTQELDFSQDRIDWHERIPEEERFQRMYGLSSFFIGEQKVAEELGPIMRAAPTEEQRIFLCAQIADEARHVRFFDRFYSEVGVLDAGDLAERLRATEEHLNPAFAELFDGLLKTRVDRLASEPEDREALIEAITLYHMVIEGMLALTGQHFIIDYNEREGTLPGFVEGFSKIARDEHRHIAFGVRFLADQVREDERNRAVIQRMLEEATPIADRVIDPPWAEEDDYELFGVSREETHAFAAQCLTRRLKVIGLMPASA
jgi:ribonucleoside-diphosphate reductase beta chain